MVALVLPILSLVLPALPVGLTELSLVLPAELKFSIARTYSQIPRAWFSIA